MSMNLFIITEQDLIVHVLNAVLTLMNPIAFQLIILLKLSSIPIQVKLWIELLCNFQNKFLVLLVVV